MVDLPLTDAPGYVIKVGDRDNDEFARYFVVCGVPDGTAALTIVLNDVNEMQGEVFRNALKHEVENMKPGESRVMSAMHALHPRMSG